MKQLLKENMEGTDKLEIIKKQIVKKTGYFAINKNVEKDLSIVIIFSKISFVLEYFGLSFLENSRGQYHMCESGELLVNLCLKAYLLVFTISSVVQSVKLILKVLTLLVFMWSFTGDIVSLLFMVGDKIFHIKLFEPSFMHTINLPQILATMMSLLSMFTCFVYIYLDSLNGKNYIFWLAIGQLIQDFIKFTFLLSRLNALFDVEKAFVKLRGIKDPKVSELVTCYDKNLKFGYEVVIFEPNNSVSRDLKENFQDVIEVRKIIKVVPSFISVRFQINLIMGYYLLKNPKSFIYFEQYFVLVVYSFLFM